ncbi:uncharacterized protein LOC111336992 isoform X1 [Stylophora pistillata]|uniref:Uncharacterized protein n=2 Tax=Stylophora pistillata TaxID=50429 RepID=A0A2B4RRZ7_STYPI|nr:uncharacterized protein LOC111336992 isoform X1 [Stylophora pistillata]XP_022798927.1 uncharacterized protein LOC111336992 isoform X1 [Stylophora pistillata]XP_022798928.1 uncharacterized protein LOC111336992 isoform X1 [Stylophora pistillata]PFX20361.1 hypothetical protein AWC38_SpisGene15196 [Stylophora pistillata]
MSSYLLLCNRFLNLVIILTLLTPATVNYYRATWHMLDLFVFPNDKLLSASFIFTVSFGTLFLLMLVEDYIKESLNARRAKAVWYRALFFPLAFLTVAAWKGLWILLDLITTPSIPSACVSHIIGLLVLVCTRTTSSIVAMPGYCLNERHANLPESILQGKHCVRNKSKTVCGETAARIFNSFVTVFIIGGAVVNYWRGTWLIILTIIQYPDNDLILSSILLIIVGYSIWIVCYVLTEFLSTIPMNPPYSILSHALEQIFVYILAFGVVSSWAGIWLLMDACLPSDRPVASALIGHFVSIAVLYVLQACINLIGSPTGCTVHSSEKLDGFDMGGYLEKPHGTEHEKQPENSVIKEGNEPRNYESLTLS